MKTRITKESTRNKPRASNNRNKTIRAKLLRRFTNEGTGVSQQSDNPEEAPHQAKSGVESWGESFNDPLEFMRYRIFETIKHIKP